MVTSYLTFGPSFSLTSFTRLCAAGLGEFRIRDLNDEINKLLREKRHWEVRIKELGGPDYAVNQPKTSKPVDKISNFDTNWEQKPLTLTQVRG